MIEPQMPSMGMNVLNWSMAVWKYLRAIRPKAGPGLILNETPSGTIISLRRGLSKKSLQLPFWPTFGKTETEGSPTTYYVTVSEGHIVDHVTMTGDALAYFDCPNRLTDNKPTKFTIEDGQAVYVTVQVRETGAIGTDDEDDPCAIEINADETESVHYVPPVGDDTAGSAGTYRYKLAVFHVDAETGVQTIDYFLAGGHVIHYRDLPQFLKEAGEFDVFKEFDPDSGLYRTKGFIREILGYTDAKKSIEITDTGSELLFRTAGKDLDLKIIKFKEDTEGRIWEETDGIEYLVFREGIFIGVFADEDTRPGSAGTVIEKTVSMYDGQGEPPPS